MRRHLIRVDGHKIGVLSANEDRPGPSVVFLHGMISSFNFWPAIIPPQIKACRRWHSLSLPGHAPSEFPSGGSASEMTVDRITSLLTALVFRELREESVDIVGWSTGAFIALAIAAQQPNRIRSVLSIAGFAQGVWSGPMGRLQRLARAGAAERALATSVLAATTRNQRLAQWFALRLADKTRRRDAERMIAAMLDATFVDISRHQPNSIVDLCRRMAEFDISDRLSDIQAPTLIVGGASDPVVPAAETRRLASRVPGAELVLLGKTGHMIFAEQMEAHRRLLLRWLVAGLRQNG